MQKVQKKSHSTHNLKKKLHETYFVYTADRTVRDHKYEYIKNNIIFDFFKHSKVYSRIYIYIYNYARIFHFFMYDEKPIIICNCVVVLRKKYKNKNVPPICCFYDISILFTPHLFQFRT